MEKYSVAVIGHGPSVVGKKLGKYIDKCNIVIRMIECDWQDEEDYGSKYTIGIYATGGSDSYLSLTKRIPSFCWWEYNAVGTVPPKDALYQDAFRTSRETKIARILRKTVWQHIIPNKKFSRGTAAAVAAIQLFHPTHLYLLGFDDVVRGSMEEGKWHPESLRQYLLQNKRSLYRDSFSHDWANESRVIATLASQYETKVVYPNGKADFR